jgi:hypothetical protein
MLMIMRLATAMFHVKQRAGTGIRRLTLGRALPKFRP